MSYKVSDMILAKETAYRGLIKRRYTHAFLDNPEADANKTGKQTLVNQAGRELCFQHEKSAKLFKGQSVIVNKQTIAD